ncbi:nitronate monooxygenase [[Clostridium] spiroforme]|nr:nitronate monooxygenase [Thomasclavelia spiroformis]MBM6879439.1 nitronate monooxygenase [Thomasclavelia spiroformis]MBM6929855.1 nitronate monooxygenase [Thomasclavelia spiroformis]
MKLNELLNIKYPIIQGGMANIATGEFAAAVSNAGGLGLIGAGGMNVETLKENIHRCRELTDKPFGVNIMLMNPQAKEMAQLVIDEKVQILTTGAGNPGVYMKAWKEAGIKVFPVVPSVALAKRMERAGADGLIVEGCEAGGHIGEMTTMALVPQVVAAVNIPVVAAGGIASGKQLLAAYALGACGAQIGTILLGSEECPIHENYKNAVLKAKDTGTIVTGRIGGTPVRILKNKMAKEYVKKEREGATLEELEVYTLGSLRKAVFDGNVDEGSLMAGQVAGMVNEIKPVKDILERLMSECQEAYQNLEI